MANYVWKLTRDREAMELCVRGESDMSGDEISSGSEWSWSSEAEEDMALDRKDIKMESSDVTWEAESSQRASKRPRGEEEETLLSRTRPRGRGRGSSSSRAEVSTSTSGERWNDVDVPDITPPQPTFCPPRAPGPQLRRSGTSHTALQLFQLYFTSSVLQTILQNTNDFGANCSSATKPWRDLTMEDMFSYMSLLIYMGVVKCSAYGDYWRQDKLYSLPFPRRVMSGRKFLRISGALHLSSLSADAANEKKRGTAAYDRLGKIQPLYEEMRDACKRNYQPSQDIAIDERMLSTKASTGTPSKKGPKLLVLADSASGYTWDFFVYEGKLQGNNGNGVTYDSVMALLDARLRGSGYKLFVDNFFTSPALFRDLLEMKVWACGTIRKNRLGVPETDVNALDSTSPLGSIRWIRRDAVLFVQWRDTKDFFMCSTVHTAHSEDTVQRRVPGTGGRRALKDIPVPPAVNDYNRSMAGVDFSGALIGFYKVLHKSNKWYMKFFFHFMDIAIVNSFLLHKDLARSRGDPPLRQKEFRETLIQELAEAGSPSASMPLPLPAPPTAHHMPVHISGHSTKGRLRCRECSLRTPLKCSSCDVALCLRPGRDCYNKWHDARDL
ncbi:piggyBac transposable element-derived protein 4-like [Limanda limanda]|uniref:piggyBac transposable element-derived protein 4-like n=1 Tax=Limanda limanda TaxID=27771 RepID=UPI0029C61AE2|nr:piggyBac transposable element-derived protein 4-like [Limanda limanda]